MLYYYFFYIFPCHHEGSWIDMCPVRLKPVFYKRYMEDAFLLFRHQSHAQLFLNYPNSQHPHMIFIRKSEIDGKL